MVNHKTQQTMHFSKFHELLTLILDKLINEIYDKEPERFQKITDM